MTSQVMRPNKMSGHQQQAKLDLCAVVTHEIVVGAKSSGALSGQ